VTYQSCEDWRSCTDILRCNPSFQSHPRYDAVILNTADELYGRLEGLFRCTLPSGRQYDVALVCKLRPTKKWRPKTVWNGCKVLEECDSMLIMMQYIVRGVLVVHASLAGGRQFIGKFPTSWARMAMRAQVPHAARKPHVEGNMAMYVPV
jgi:hypothetical protein